ncbi:hypothetical protein [uncultured Flavobacterium sp.]|uniref:hypothetical protein n=1 Tax=uncultured Flavobacterium sp. TaxID=165435 RepID=UPI0025D66DFC|nr:hypothetical protein [uncultured Flavobacterium sp.]
MKRILAVFIVIFICTVVVFAQGGESGRIKMLKDEITKTQQLTVSNPDEGFSRIDDLLQQAKNEEYKDGELALLALRCWYYTNKDLKKAITATQELQRKAEAYDSSYYNALVHEYFATIYVRSELLDKALEECDVAIKLFDKITDKQKIQEAISHKANVYSVANEAYTAKKRPREAVQMLLKANREIKNLEDAEKRKNVLKANYTNLGGAYAEFDLDSAEYYVNKSVLLGSSNGKQDIIQFNNNILLGYIYKDRKEYARSISNYKKAESQLPYINSSLENINQIYGDLAEVYKAADSLEQANIYLQKLQHSLLDHEQNKNKSLHKIIDNQLLKEKSYSVVIGAALGVVIFLMSLFLIRLHRKNKLLSRQEQVSEEYLKGHAEIATVDDAALSRLIEMVKADDDAFMASFHSYFPAFMEKLREIHPSIVPSEIEFCALLKLNLSTKDIARYRSIEPKSVQNKKYRIRKKLNIPDDVDIYFWFNTF